MEGGVSQGKGKKEKGKSKEVGLIFFERSFTIFLETGVSLFTLSRMTVTLPERSLLFSKQLLHNLSHLPNTSVIRILTDQLLRSGTSIGANITEAQYAATRKQFFQYYRIALRSSRETEYWLALLATTDVVPKEVIAELQNAASQLSRILAASLLKEKIYE